MRDIYIERRIKEIRVCESQQGRVARRLRVNKMAAVAMWLAVAAVAPLPLVRGCHWTTVTITNGTLCCGGKGGVSATESML